MGDFEQRAIDSKNTIYNFLLQNTSRKEFETNGQMEKIKQGHFRSDILKIILTYAL